MTKLKVVALRLLQALVLLLVKLFKLKTMEPIHKDRFLKLYNHMTQPQSKLGHEMFFFGCFNNKVNACGTMGCMAGELPVIFPNDWYFDEYKDVRLIHGLNFGVKIDLKEFFNITKHEAEHLFYPGMQDSKIDPYFFDHRDLPPISAKEAVVENLRRFLVIKGIL